MVKEYLLLLLTSMIAGLTAVILFAAVVVGPDHWTFLFNPFVTFALFVAYASLIAFVIKKMRTPRVVIRIHIIELTDEEEN
jgi:hypothetical protein